MSYYNENELKDFLKKIDFNDEQLFDNPKYKKLSRRKVLLKSDNSIREGIVNVDYYCEKYILTQEQINKLKPSRYDINTTHNIDGFKVNYEDLSRELHEECDRKVDQRCIRDKLVGKGGIADGLEKNLKIKLSNYAEEKIAINKLLKLLYKLEKRDRPGAKKKKSNVTLMLRKPTLENVDNSVINYDTANGKIINYVKNEVMKELTPEFIGRVKFAVHETVGIWAENVLNMLLKTMDGTISDDLLLERLALVESRLKKIVLNAQKQQDVSKLKRHALFEIFYLKIIQSENIAREKNLQEINQWILNVEWEHKGKITIKKQVIQEPLLESYIEKNIGMIAMHVYYSINPSEEQKNEVLAGIKYYKKIFELMERHTKTSYTVYCPSFKLIIACIQTYLKCKEDDIKYYNGYYGTDGNAKTLISVLKNNGRDQEAYELCWVGLVQYKYYVNKGYKKSYSKLKDIENQFSMLIIAMLNMNNIYEMQIFNAVISKLVWDSIRYKINEAN